MKTKIAIAVLLATTCNATLLLAQDGGWQKAKWGMTRDQVKAVYPNVESFTETGHPEKTGLLLKEPFAYSTQEFVVRFFFGTDGGLHNVTLNMRSDKLIPDKIHVESTSSYLRQHLVEKYGPPSFNEKDAVMQTWKWNRPGANIEVIETSMNVLLCYMQPNKAVLDKL